MRKENADKFEVIKQELTDKVIADIKEWGNAKIFLEYSTEHDRIEKNDWLLERMENKQRFPNRCKETLSVKRICRFRMCHSWRQSFWLSD